MTEADRIKAQGASDYRSGVPNSPNPYQYVSQRNGGVFKAAWWDSGWKQAKSESQGNKDGSRL